MGANGSEGRVLHVDLTTGRARHVDLPQGVRRRYVGGAGLGTWLLHRESPAGVDPLAREAAVVFAVAPLVGTPLTTSAKFAVVSKSPLTDRLNDAMAGDRFAIALGACGVEALVVRGCAARPTLLVIEDDDVRLEDATHLIGLSAADAESRVAEALGGSYAFVGTGPAGEQGVRYATVSGGGRHAGRGGTGAVFGAKHLKGIAIRGTQRREVAHPAQVRALARDLSKRSLGEGTSKYRDLGTIANVLVFNRLGALPTRNFQASTFEQADEVSAESFHAARGRMRKHCQACTIGCEHVFSTPKGGVRLEYEGLFALGPLCGIGERSTILEAARRCDAHGLDVISAGGTIAWAMEAGERGLLEGAPAFGDGAGLLALLDDIAARRGLGDLLADGSRRASQQVGGGSEAFACHVKGLELPGYEPRALQAMAVGLAVGTRGADHNRSGAYEEDFRPGADRLRADPAKGAAAAASEERAALIDSLVLCKFLRGVFQDLEAEAATMLAAVTGWDVTREELVATSRRIVLAKRLFNEREGWTRAEDTLPERFLAESLPDGAAEGAALSRPDLNRMIARYYEARGCTPDGRVPQALVEAAQLDDLRPAAQRTDSDT